MNFRNLLAVHPVRDTLQSLNAAVSLARQFDAHLEVLALNLASPIPTMSYVQNPDFDWSHAYADLLEQNGQKVSEIEQWLARLPVSSETSSVCQQLGLIDDETAERALYADLALFSRNDESFTSGMLAKALKGVTVDAGKPVLILDGTVTLGTPPFPAVSIAWDESPGAMRAIAASLPFLVTATEVELLMVVDADDHLAEGRSLKIRKWLERAGVNATLVMVRRNDRMVSETLLEYVNDNKRDLIVMGAYGHMKIAERIFAGVTHLFLEHAKTALLLAH